MLWEIVWKMRCKIRWEILVQKCGWKMLVEDVAEMLCKILCKNKSFEIRKKNIRENACEKCWVNAEEML